jgi:hypothetical protein
MQPKSFVEHGERLGRDHAETSPNSFDSHRAHLFGLCFGVATKP